MDAGDAFARRQAGGHDVLDHEDAGALVDGEAAPQAELALDPLEEDRCDPQLPRHLKADDDATHGGRGNQIDLSTDLGLDLLDKNGAQPGGARRVHQDARALQISRAVQSGGQDEMAFEQRAGRLEFRQNLVLGHFAAYPSARSTELTRGLSLRSRMIWLRCLRSWTSSKISRS